MPLQQPSERLQLGRRLQVSWRTIALFAVVLTLADVFWMVTIRGAVGAIEHIQTPFVTWIRQSMLLLPVFFAVVTGAVLLGQRVAARRRPGVRMLAAAAMIVLATTVAATATVAAVSAIDYQAQSELLGLTHSAHSPTVPLQQNIATTDELRRCDAICQARRDTVQAHVRAAAYGSVVVLVTNVVLVLWILAMLGGRLFTPAGARRRPDVDDQAASPAAVLV